MKTFFQFVAAVVRRRVRLITSAATLCALCVLCANAAFALGGIGRFQNCYEVVPAGVFIPTNCFSSSTWVTENGATVSFPSTSSTTFTGRGNSSDITTYSNWITQSENWLMTWTETMTASNSTSYGIGGGVRSIFNTTLSGASGQRSYYGQMGRTGTNDGVLFLYQWHGGTAKVEANSAAMSPLPIYNDTILCGFGRETNCYYMWAVDTRTSASNYISWPFVLSAFGTGSPLAADNLVGRFGFWIAGGTATVTNFSVASTLNTPIFLLNTGASIDVGFSATNNQARWMGVLQSNCFYPVRSCCASYSVGSNFINCEPEYAFLHPLNMIMPDIGNDIIFSALTPGMTNDFTNFVAWATQTNGSMITVKTPTPHGSTDETRAYSFITNYYPNCIDLWTPLANGHVLQAAYQTGESPCDHPNPLGHYVMGTNMLAAFCHPPFTPYTFPPQ
jgi:hypothetical protein